jgi:hypothetical protein
MGFRDARTGEKVGRHRWWWVAAPGRGRRLGAERLIRGKRAGQAFLAARAPRAHTSNLLLVTPFMSLLMGPAGAARAGRCGVRSANTGGPRAGPGVPGRGNGSDWAGPGPSDGEERPLGSSRASTTSRGARGRGDCSSLAQLSLLSLNFNPKQKHSPPASNAAPHWAEPPGPRNAGGGEERSAAAAAARAHPSPTRAQSRTVRPRAAGARGGSGASPLPPPRQASSPGEGEAGKCLSVCVFV